MSAQAIITIILAAIGVAGTVGTFYFGLKSFRLERARNSFTWDDVETGALDILKRAEKDFRPHILLMVSGPGGIVTSLAMVRSGRYYPVYTAMLEDKRGPLFPSKPAGYTEVSTQKWNIYLPNILSGENEKRVLIIDDCVMSGDLQAAVRRFLLDHGFAKQNIFFATLICSKIAMQSNKAPDIYWYLNPHGEFYFPWGSWF